MATATQALKRMKWLFQLKNNWIDIAIDKKVDPFPNFVGVISTNALQSYTLLVIKHYIKIEVISNFD